MDLKDEIKVGDYVIYKDSGEVVCDADTKCPLKIIDFTLRRGHVVALYENGEFDFLLDIQKASTLLLELLWILKLEMRYYV